MKYKSEQELEATCFFIFSQNISSTPLLTNDSTINVVVADYKYSSEMFVKIFLWSIWMSGANSLTAMNGCGQLFCFDALVVVFQYYCLLYPHLRYKYQVDDHVQRPVNPPRHASMFSLTYYADLISEILSGQPPDASYSSHG